MFRYAELKDRLFTLRLCVYVYVCVWVCVCVCVCDCVLRPHVECHQNMFRYAELKDRLFTLRSWYARICNLSLPSSVREAIKGQVMESAACVV
jgi:hypothetical protein